MCPLRAGAAVKKERIMAKKEAIRKDMYTAMKEGKKTLKDSLSMLLQAIQKAEKEKLKEKKPPVLTDGEEASVIMKEISQLNETIRSCPAERTDILDACRERIAVYEKYAPVQMTEEEIRSEIADVLSELGIEAPTAKDRGRIMKTLMPRVKGRANGKDVNDAVSALFA